VPAAVKVKAAGGISTLETLLAMLDAGADRVGCSATAALLDELAARHG
jgi:deoxyribose-phosphate aldolase